MESSVNAYTEAALDAVNLPFIQIQETNWSSSLDICTVQSV